MCPKDCSQIYYTIGLDNKYYFTESDSVIKVKYKSSQEFQYIAENSQTFVSYMSNIGALISLWFGLAFVDIETLVKFSLRKIRYFLMQKLHLDKLIEAIKSIIMKQFVINFIYYVHQLERYNWRKTISITCIPLLLLQFYQLIYSYLQFSTEVTVELVSYLDSDNNIRLNALPAITVCVESIFERIVNDKKMSALFSRLEDRLINHTLRDKQYHMLPYNEYEVNKSLNNIALEYSLKKSISFLMQFWAFKEFENSWDYWTIDNDDTLKEYNRNLFDFTHLYLLDEDRSDFELLLKYRQTVNEILFELFFCIVNVHQSNTKYSKACDATHHVLNIVSPFGKCYTYFYNNQSNDNLLENYYMKSLFLIRIKEYKMSQQYQSKYEDDYQTIKPIDKKFIIHHASSLPIVTDFEIGVTHTNLIQANSFVMIITKVEFERLPYPYETDCIEYKNDTLFDCLNKCYRKKYLNEIQCIPFNNGLVTFKIDNDTLKENRFCTNQRTRLNDSNLNELSQKIKSECSVICGTPCNELYHSTKYHESYDDLNSHNRFYLSQRYFLKIIYLPKKLFSSLIIDLANIWSLWYGISMTQLLNILIRSCKKKMFAFVIRKFKVPKLFFKCKVRVILADFSYGGSIFYDSKRGVYNFGLTPTPTPPPASNP